MSDHTLSLDEGERQALLLALAHLAVERPGWDDMLNRVAVRIDNVRDERAVMYDEFRALDTGRSMQITMKRPPADGVSRVLIEQVLKRSLKPVSTMKLVIIESPYKGDVARNTRYLRACIRDCIRRGESPYASHRMLTDALNDDDPEERSTGIEAGLAWRHARQPVFDNDSDPANGYILRYNVVAHAFYVDLDHSKGMLLAKERYDNEGILYEERRLPPDDPFFTEEPPQLAFNFESDAQTIRMLLVGAYGGDPDARSLVELARAVAEELDEWRSAGRAIGIEATTKPHESVLSVVRTLEHSALGPSTRSYLRTAIEESLGEFETAAWECERKITNARERKQEPLELDLEQHVQLTAKIATLKEALQELE